MKLCIDIGGTNIRLALFAKSNKPFKKIKIKTNSNNFDLNRIWFESFFKEHKQINKISVGMPGPANYEIGLLINPPNLKGWWNLDLKKFLKLHTNAKTIVFNNDAKLMALANHKKISKNNNDITQFFTISTGIGAGLIINNKIFQGSSGLAQEIAHIPVNTIDEKNHLSKGAVEYFASGSGIKTRGQKYGYSSTQAVFDSYKNNKNAKKIIDDAIEALGNLIASSVAFINPNYIIFDGSVARINPWYIEKAIKLAKLRMYNKQAHSFEWLITSLEDDSAITGALIVMEENNG